MEFRTIVFGNTLARYFKFRGFLTMLFLVTFYTRNAVITKNIISKIFLIIIVFNI